jgi:hypothetical protein
MYRITYVIDLFKGPEEQELSHKVLNILLHALMLVDMEYLRAHPEVPPLYQSGVRYEEEPPGQEDWQDVPTTLKLKVGDCLPVSTLVLREDFTSVEIGTLKAGDLILGDGTVTKVLDFAFTGKKPIIALTLDNGEILRASPNHRLILEDDSEIRTDCVKIGNKLKSPTFPFSSPLTHSKNSVEVVGISDGEPELCCDITTDTGRFYLPEYEVVVHNCEDLACWRAAELRVRYGIKAVPTFIWKVRPAGGYLYHIQVKLPDGRVEDPSRALGMR